MARTTTFVVQVTKGTQVPPDRTWRPAVNAPVVYIGASSRQIEAARNAAITSLVAAGVAVHSSGATFTTSGTPIGWAIVSVSKAGVL